MVGLCGGAFYYWHEHSGILIEDIETRKDVEIISDIKTYVENKLEKVLKRDEMIDSEISSSERIARMPSLELSESIDLAKEKIDHEDLINRLNAGKVSQRELEEAKILFESVALMSLERAQRQLKEQEPELERGLENIGQELAEIRDLLHE